MQTKSSRYMELKDLLGAVRNDRVEFVTMRPPGSPFATLERRVVVSGPPELVTLSGMGDLAVLDALVALLQVPDQAWAAVVVLAAMTRVEEKIVDSFATMPDEWLNSLGKTAHERWRNWLQEKRERLQWDADKRVFVAIE
jgi:hypothetical protein